MIVIRGWTDEHNEEMVVLVPDSRGLFLFCLTNERLNSHGAVNVRIAVFRDMKPCAFCDR